MLGNKWDYSVHHKENYNFEKWNKIKIKRSEKENKNEI